MSQEKDIGKWFSNMPPELEKYNPDSFKNYEISTSTYDEFGKFHSYDDEPSYVDFRGSHSLISWYSHGILLRGVQLYPDESFITFQVNRQVHSFDDKPSSINYDAKYNRFDLKWNHNGELHRENDLPALIQWESGHSQAHLTEYYYEYGDLHREGGKPAVNKYMKTEWLVYGSLHRIDGQATVYKKNTSERSKRHWGLYGLEMEKRTFDSIFAYKNAAQVPLWVAALYVFRLINEDKIDAFRNDSGAWELTVPLTWALHLWEVDDTTLLKSIHELRAEDFDVWVTRGTSKPSSPVEKFMKIITLEEKNSQPRTNQKTSI